MKNFSYLPAYEVGTECSETSAYKIQTSGNYPEESIRRSEHSESLKSRHILFVLKILNFFFRSASSKISGNEFCNLSWILPLLL